MSLRYVLAHLPLSTVTSTTFLNIFLLLLHQLLLFYLIQFWYVGLQHSMGGIMKNLAVVCVQEFPLNMSCRGTQDQVSVVVNILPCCTLYFFP